MRETVPAPPSPQEPPLLPGVASLVNVTTVLVGATIGVLLGNRLPVRTRDVVTDALGLVTLLIAATSAMEVLSPDLSDEVGDSAPMLIVLGSLLVGGIIGSLLRLESRVEHLGAWLQVRLSAPRGGTVESAARERQHGSEPPHAVFLPVPRGRSLVAGFPGNVSLSGSRTFPGFA